MSSSPATSARSLPRPALEPALAELVDAAAVLANVPYGHWVDSRLRAAVLAELGLTLPELSEAHVLPLMRWVTGNSALDLETLPDAQSLGEALGLLLPEAPKRKRARLQVPVTVPFFDADALENAMTRVRDEDQRHHFRALKDSGELRTVRPVASREQRKITQLLGQAPHLREATDSVLGALAVARRANAPLQQRPLLLSGPPATGKTWWAEQVAGALGVPCVRIVMPKVTASFALSGSTPSWSNSRPGRIVQEFMSIHSATPILILDEVDKASSGNYDPAPVLLDLLEPASARHWHDEYFGIDFDVSRAIIVATANRPQDMDPALRSRFREIEVARPGKRELPAVIRSTWDEHRRQYPGLRLPRELPGDAIDSLIAGFTSIRSLQRSFEDAVARAARRPGRLRLLPSDLAGSNPLKLVGGMGK